MSKIICANGDSFTQELYLEPKNRWTNGVGVTDNLALGGGSNDRIFYTTIEYLNHYYPDVLLIGWTTISRGMLSNSNGSRIIVTPGHTFDENLGGNYSEHSKFYFKNCHNDFVNFKNTLEYMIHLQEYCKIKNIKLWYYNALLEHIDEKSLLRIASTAFMNRDSKDIEEQGIKHNLNLLKALIKKLNTDIWIKELWYSIPTHCGDFPREKSGHPDVEGSAHWADLVKKYL
jgi:hypothetical protein